MSYALTKAAWPQKTGSSSNKLILLALCWLSGPERRCAVSNAVLAHWGCMSDRTVSKALAALIDGGFISARRRGRGREFTVLIELLPEYPEIDAHGQATCTYCGAVDRAMEMDHIHPRALGGTDAHDNLTIACLPCNADKGAIPLEEWMQ